jgi:hypothetical protein
MPVLYSSIIVTAQTASEVVDSVGCLPSVDTPLSCVDCCSFMDIGDSFIYEKEKRCLCSAFTKALIRLGRGCEVY